MKKIFFTFLFLFAMFSTVALVGSTKTGGMYTSDDFYTYLSSESIGEAFRDWWISSLGNNHTNYKTQLSQAPVSFGFEVLRSLRL